MASPGTFTLRCYSVDIALDIGDSSAYSYARILHQIFDESWVRINRKRNHFFLIVLIRCIVRTNTYTLADVSHWDKRILLRSAGMGGIPAQWTHNLLKWIIALA